MKKFWVFAVVAVALLVYAGSTGYGIRLGEFAFEFSPDRQHVFDATKRFLEDVQFKDFDHASGFHTEEDRKKKKIPQLIEEKFLTKPEFLDIRHFEILRLEISSAGDRARVLTRTTMKQLNSEQLRGGKEDVKNVDTIWYWKKTGGKWFMDLQSSL
ncbi:MAG: hypothetical protein HY303_12495 [Candidatus Wallbacteria bacterium]|nr:hypothetical protein [Candidatus Wallbacteria bacterium]